MGIGQLEFHALDALSGACRLISVRRHVVDWLEPVVDCSIAPSHVLQLKHWTMSSPDDERYSIVWYNSALRQVTMCHLCVVRIELLAGGDMTYLLQYAIG